VSRTDKDESINPEKKQMITLAQQDFVSQPQVTPPPVTVLL
jgi:hypothetical protein